MLDKESIRSFLQIRDDTCDPGYPKCSTCVWSNNKLCFNKDVLKNLDVAIEMAEKLIAENKHTYLKEFRKRFPECKIDITEEFCVSLLFDLNLDCTTDDSLGVCEECWNREYKKNSKK